MAKQLVQIPGENKNEKMRQFVGIITKQVIKELRETKETQTTQIVVKESAKTPNGRPMTMGSIYWEESEGGGRVMKYCAGYCPRCKEKIGLTRKGMEEFAEHLPPPNTQFLWRLFHARIILPR